MRLPMLQLLGALTLALVILGVSSVRPTSISYASSSPAAGAWVQAGDSASLDLSVLPGYTSAGPRVVEQATGQTDGCWQYDSWCHYCARHPGSSACTKYPPAKHP